MIDSNWVMLVSDTPEFKLNRGVVRKYSSLPVIYTNQLEENPPENRPKTIELGISSPEIASITVVLKEDPSDPESISSVFTRISIDSSIRAIVIRGASIVPMDRAMDQPTKAMLTAFTVITIFDGTMVPCLIPSGRFSLSQALPEAGYSNIPSMH